MKELELVLKNSRLVNRFITVGKNGDAVDASCKVIKNIFDDAPTLGLDLDGTIDESPEFFKILSKVWPGLVIIITCRNDIEKARADVARFDVYYDELVMVRRLEDKAAVIKEYNVQVYVDDQDECLSNIPDNVTVLKIRNPGNFDAAKWLYSNDTGENISNRS